MGDFNFLPKFSEMSMCYFGIFKDVLSSLRKPCPGDCYFCPCLVVSAFQTGKWGFSSRVGNFFSPLPSPFQSGPITSKTSPSSSAGFVGCFFCSPHLSSREGLPTCGWPRFDKTPFPSIPYLMGYASPLYSKERWLTSHWNKRSCLFFFPPGGTTFAAWWIYFSSHSA